MRSILGNRVETLKDQILLLYYGKGSINGPYCKLGIERIVAFVESVRGTLLFDIFEKIVDYILLNVKVKSGRNCFDHMPYCFKYKPQRSRYKRIYTINHSFYGRLADFKYETTRGISRFNVFAFYICCKYGGFKIIVYEDDHILDQLDINRLCYFDVDKDEVWVRIDPGAIVCKWF